MVLSTALACVGSLDAALRTFFDIDVADEQQRAQLATDIRDIILHGVIPQDYQRLTTE